MVESDPATFPVEVGSRLFTADGNDVGEVREVTATHFKVDDFWLSKATLQRANPQSAILSFNEEQIEDFKLDSPDLDSASPILDAQLNTFSSPQEQDERRREQERGYGHTAPSR